jgi:Zn-dependent alcohol dehydrogenases
MNSKNQTGTKVGLLTRGFATTGAAARLEPFEFTRRDPGPHDVLIEILYCGICHSDIHQARNEWNEFGEATYPMVPGHEILGKVEHVGSEVKTFKEGDLAGIGCFVDSCRTCASCREGLEQHCEIHLSLTYNGTEQDTVTPTYGGYSSQIVVDENYVYKISPELPLANTAPLMCAGITTYSPLRRYNVGPGSRVAVIGLGGLGHMGVKLAASMGAEVTVLSTSKSKEDDARSLGAHDFVITRDPANLEALEKHFDFLLDTASAAHNLTPYLKLLRRDGAMVVVGAPEKPVEVHTFALITNSRILTGSAIGGLRETQEMLDYCAKHKIVADVEIIPIQQVNEAYTRVTKGDVRYRFVIDMKTL